MSNKHSSTKVESHGFLHDQKIRRITGDIFAHLFLAILAVIWLVPIVWVFAESFNKNTAPYTSSFFPKEWTLDNYKVLFTDRNVLDFPKMFMTTFIIACFTCVISVIFVLSVAYCMSRMRFRVRKTFMNVVLILGMFPGIMAVTAIYFILKALGLSSGAMTTVALILVYSAGSGAGFYVMKGYMDTIPTSLDEAALLDGCTRFQVFYKIIIPICKPMIVYQAIIGFLTPWLDFVMAKVICRTQSNYTVALGLWLMLQKEYIQNWYARFAAAAVVISIPIAILFIVMQRFYQESMSGSVKGLITVRKRGSNDARKQPRKQFRTAEYESRRTVPALSGTAAGCRGFAIRHPVCHLGPNGRENNVEVVLARFQGGRRRRFNWAVFDASRGRWLLDLRFCR